MENSFFFQAQTEQILQKITFLTQMNKRPYIIV